MITSNPLNKAFIVDRYASGIIILSKIVMEILNRLKWKNLERQMVLQNIN